MHEESLKTCYGSFFLLCLGTILESRKLFLFWSWSNTSIHFYFVFFFFWLHSSSLTCLFFLDRNTPLFSKQQWCAYSPPPKTESSNVTARKENPGHGRLQDLSVHCKGVSFAFQCPPKTIFLFAACINSGWERWQPWGTLSSAVVFNILFTT